METLQQKLTKLIDSTGITQAAVAKAIGFSPSGLNTWLKGLYQGDVDKIDKKVRDYLETTALRVESIHGIVQTTTLRAIHSYCTLVLQKRGMGMLTGDSGAGKTTALREYVRLHPAVIMVEADPGYTARALFLDLCEALNLDSRGSLHDIFTRVVNKLRGSGRLVIIDEAEQLPYRALELIRRVHDKAGVGIALCGMPRLERNLKGDPNHYAQLYRRILIPRRVDGLTIEDMDSIIELELENVSSEVRKAFHLHCTKNARILSNLLMWSLDILQRSKENATNTGKDADSVVLTPAIIHMASEMLVAA